MKLTMTPVGRTSNGPSIDQREESIIQYEVRGIPGNPYVVLFATTTAQEGKTWIIQRDGEDESIKYPSAQAALDALEKTI